MSKPSQRDKDRLERIISAWRERLGLLHWRWEIEWDYDAEDEDDKDEASVWRPKNYNDAKFRFKDGWHELGNKKLNQLVVHEWLHPATRDIEGFWDQIDGMLHRDVEQVAMEIFKHSLENFIDQLSWSIVDNWGIIE